MRIEIKRARTQPRHYRVGGFELFINGRNRGMFASYSIAEREAARIVRAQEKIRAAAPERSRKAGRT